MKKFLELISEEMGKGFEAAGYEAQLGRVTVSNRPDLCEYQCNGAMAGAKAYKKAPFIVYEEQRFFVFLRNEYITILFFRFSIAQKNDEIYYTLS